MSQKHHRSGSSFPPLEKDRLRVYSMRFCPYAQRVLLVLHHKQIPYELVNINLRDKPSWFIEKNPITAKVPTLQINDKIVYGSEICIDYLDEAFPGPKLTLTDPFVKARARMLGSHFDKVLQQLPELWHERLGNKEADFSSKFRVITEALQRIEQMIPNTKFLAGDEVSMVDYYCWPWLERRAAIAEVLGTDIFPSELLPKLISWVENMAHTPAVQGTIITPEQHRTYILSTATSSPACDTGIE